MLTKLSILYIGVLLIIDINIAGLYNQYINDNHYKCHKQYT